MDSVYRLRPGKITTTGLTDIDFSRVKFISIMLLESQSAIMQSCRVSDYRDLLLKIRPDYSIKIVTEVEADSLK